VASRKHDLRNEAIQRICRDLKANIDWQEIVQEVGNDDRYQPLVEGKSDEEAEEYLNGMIRSAEMLLGWRQ
jgi:uncharacterized protein YnzC (UPF0291/DUF896 family)